MQILFISQSAAPVIGGVQKHISGVIDELSKKNLQIELIAIDRWNIPQVKFIGLLMIWARMLTKWRQIKNSEVIFIHDVFIYFLPWRILLPHKKIVTIFHGFEKEFPIPYKNILYKRLASKLSKFTISIGSYVNKYYGLSEKNNRVSYGATLSPQVALDKKQKQKQFVFLGRLEKDTGLSIFLDFLNILKEKKINFRVDFLGDGPLKSACQKYGAVHGFVTPDPYLTKSNVCFASGYMSILEAMSYQNICLTAYNSELKKNYLSDSPFASAIIIADSAIDLFNKYQQTTDSAADKMLADGQQIARQHNFKNLAKLYLDCIYE